MTEEVRFFRRVSIYALIVGVIYWFVSYEWIGTTLLMVFGIGGGVGTLLLWRGARERTEGAAVRTSGAAPGVAPGGAPGGAEESARTEAQGPFADESGRLPASTAAPLLLGLAVALGGLGLVFGPWFLLVAVVPFAAGAGSWLRGVRGELEGVEMDDAAPRRGQDADALGEPDGDVAGEVDGAADGAALSEPDGAGALADGTGEGVGSGVKTPAAPKRRP